MWWTGDVQESLEGAVNVADRSSARAGAAVLDSLEWPELDDGYAAHAPVHTFRANPFGLHHVHGNLLEWCGDGYAFYPESAGRDPLVLPSRSDLRVSRGGCYDYPTRIARSAYRNLDKPDFADYDIGLRPARAVALP